MNIRDFIYDLIDKINTKRKEPNPYKDMIERQGGKILYAFTQDDFNDTIIIYEKKGDFYTLSVQIYKDIKEYEVCNYEKYYLLALLSCIQDDFEKNEKYYNKKLLHI